MVKIIVLCIILVIGSAPIEPAQANCKAQHCH